MSGWLRGAAALLIAGAMAAHAADTPAPTSVRLVQDGFALRLPLGTAVMYRGVVNHDEAGLGQGAMMYPVVGGLAGLLVAVATHAAINESQKDSQKTRLQEAADRVLEPYKDLVAQATHRELMQQALARVQPERARLVEAVDTPAGLVVESVPVYSMTQDHTSLILENVVAVYAAADPKKPLYTNVVKVVSDPVAAESEAATAAWTADEGRRFKEESVDLFAHSLRLLFESSSPEAPTLSDEKTVRYVEGVKPKAERAQVVRQGCGRAVMRTLRGWWVSVPLRQVAVPAPSDAASAPASTCSAAGRYAT